MKHLTESILLLFSGTTLGIAGETLDQIDTVLGIILKAVSIISFLTVIIINLKNIKKFLWNK